LAYAQSQNPEAPPATQDYHPRKWKPRSLRDCINCQSGISLVILKPNSDVVPYAQRKSTRGCKKGLSTNGHACSNPNCDFFGITDLRIHALVGDGKRGKQKHIQYWKCQWRSKRFTSRLHTPLYDLKSDEGHIILSLMLLAEGCDISVLVRCSHNCEVTIPSEAGEAFTRWLERAGKHSSLLHNRLFRDLVLTFVQMDEPYYRVRRTGKMWLWLAIPGETGEAFDSVTISSQRFYGKILPALHHGLLKVAGFEKKRVGCDKLVS
jgi:hypothetical protein